MKRGNYTKLSLTIALIVFTFISLTGFSQSYQRDYIDGHIYLKFKDQVQVNIPVNSDKSVDLDNAPFLDALRQQFDITGMIRPLDLNNDSKLLKTFELHFSQFDQIEEIKAELAKNPDLEYVENVPLYYINYTPNDSLYNLYYGYSNWNWHLDVINAEMAWDLNQGSAEINVAVVDVAVWIDHPDLINKIVSSHDVTQAGNQNSNPPESGDPAAWSHGTHCAGLVGAESNNLIGVASIGYNVSLIGVKASPDSSPQYITHGDAGINWAANNGADVISCSWGRAGYSNTSQNLINTVYGMGIIVVAAAGNNGVNTPYYPAGYNHVINVASTDETDIKSDFSNYGTKVDVCAPGGYSATGTYGLLSSTYEFTTTYGFYNLIAGTSMACPIAAGLCGVILSVNPELTPDQVESILEASCDDIDAVPGNEAWAGQLGAGRIDAYAAISTTPYPPVANFSTPVPYITPGTAIQFFDNSTGVPDSWSWEFTGGTPHLSSQQNPTVQFSSEGVYTVYLEAGNDFDSDLETKVNYITVTSTPVPWVVFSASASTTCNKDTLVFTDESLYEPTSWNWEFQPSTVTFVEGTTLNSQNPHVRFDAPGVYSVTLTAANANGSSFKTTDDMISVEGIMVNYTEDFESGESNIFKVRTNSKAKAKIDSRAAAPGSAYGLHFHGNHFLGGWSGGPANTTPEQAWNTNVDFHGFAENCSVDASGIAGIGLTLDLRQTFSIGNKFSWFRVLVNGQQISDINGVSDFNPATNTDPFEMKTFDLSQFGNSLFSITFQSACYIADKYYGEGDNVFVDNIMISNTTGAKEGGGNVAGVITYPNPVHAVLNYSASGTGEQISVKVLNMQGQIIFNETINGYNEGDVRQINTENLNAGFYILQISGNDGTVVKKFVIE